MSKCLHCHEDLSEVGVVELIGYLAFPDEDGDIPFDQRCSNRLDDTEGYRCGHCGEDLDWKDEANFTHIIGEDE